MGPKEAIVAVQDGNGLAFVGLCCTEMPEAWFEDVLSVVCESQVSQFPIDPLFLQVCVPGSIVVTSAQPRRPCLIGAYIEGGHVYVETLDNPKEPLPVVLRLTGLRANCNHTRFKRHTPLEAAANTRFWSLEHVVNQYAKDHRPGNDR